MIIKFYFFQFESLICQIDTFDDIFDMQPIIDDIKCRFDTWYALWKRLIVGDLLHSKK